MYFELGISPAIKLWFMAKNTKRQKRKNNKRKNPINHSNCVKRFIY